ncbi:protein NRT1/ PTR FAMILY 8.1-like [Salvia hispanica]|uniref:protein NRT1/ PTR FAMILY 8.1-like n=1 Tax=Salvia hispanica TaxID=49212 RepID=UPI002009BEBC|nr:protein NRT1/ PTR FAMILY 8.1-like [Salvia hispanica]
MAEEDDNYTKDGTVDYKGRPANRKKTGKWRACPFIVGCECCERLAYYGMSSNLFLYFTNQLNEHNAAASKNLSNWAGTCYVMPLVGAFIADSYLGRYWTIATFSIIYVIGMTLLTLSASVRGLRPTCQKKDKCHATWSQTAVCFVALYLVALGTGGIKPCVSSYGADQFDDADEDEKLHKASFFNWFYLSINIGALTAGTLLVWVQVNVGWGLGFGIPTVAMGGAVVLFFAGTRLYRYRKPGDSPLTRMCQVVVAAVRKRNVPLPDDISLLYETSDADSVIVGSRKLEHTNELRYFDKAAVEIESDHVRDSTNPWSLCTVTQVEELKGIFRLLPVCATGIMFSTVYGQMGNLFVLQAVYMDAKLTQRFAIPEASLSIFDTLSVIFWVPVYDRLVVPAARRLTGCPTGITQLQRIGVGLFVSVFAMVAAAVLEIYRLREVVRHGPGTMSIFWQVPQYFIIGCAEVFANIGQMEFFYGQAPDSMRSLCAALSLATTALGSYLSAALVEAVTVASARGGAPGWIPDDLNRGNLHYFFFLLALLSVVNLVVFVFVARRYTY